MTALIIASVCVIFLLIIATGGHAKARQEAEFQKNKAYERIAELENEVNFFRTENKNLVEENANLRKSVNNLLGQIQHLANKRNNIDNNEGD